MMHHANVFATFPRVPQERALSAPQPASLAGHSNLVRVNEEMWNRIRGDMTKHPDSSAGKAARTEAYPDEQVTVLLIDDVETVVDVFRQGLTAQGYDVMPALCGQEGLKLFQDNRVDVVICDLGMPLMDGWEVAKAIRDTCAQRGIAKPPFILFTGWADRIQGEDQDPERGVDCVLAKPATLEELVRTIERVLEKPRE